MQCISSTRFSFITQSQKSLFNLFISVICHDKKAHTVAPRYNESRYNEDPVITNNIWKPGRITVKYRETKPAITNPAITKNTL